MPPLGPPPPFALNPTGTIPDDEQAKSAMLMSWYMAGYHTGYYAASKFCHLVSKMEPLGPKYQFWLNLIEKKPFCYHLD